MTIILTKLDVLIYIAILLIGSIAIARGATRLICRWLDSRPNRYRLSWRRLIGIG